MRVRNYSKTMIPWLCIGFVCSSYTVAVSSTCQQSILTCIDYNRKFNVVDTSLQISDLKPYTDYKVNLTVHNGMGSAVSPNLQFKTMGDRKYFICSFDVL